MNSPSQARNFTESSDDPEPSSSQPQKVYERYLRKKKEAKRAEQIARRIESNSQRYGDLELPPKRLNNYNQQDYVDKLLNKVSQLEKQLLAERQTNASLQASNSKLKAYHETQDRRGEEYAIVKTALQKKHDDFLQLERNYAALLQRNEKLESALQTQLEILNELQIPSINLQDQAHA